MPTASPAFFTYYSPQTYNKDWIYRSDNWLLATRWENIISFRNRTDLVELLTWNGGWLVSPAFMLRTCMLTI